jgi:exopolysaccharide biosynthesis polyprenyl glycosylphosphotransferase
MTVLSERWATGATTRRTAWTPAAISLGALAVDVVVVAMSGVLATLGREHTHLFDKELEVHSSLNVAGPLILVGWILVIFLVGGYRRDVFGVGADEYKRVGNAGLLAAALVGISCYLTQFQLSRGFYFLLFLIGVPSLLVGRLGWRKTIQVARTRGALSQRVLISGSPSYVDEIASVLRRQPWLGYHVVGALTPPEHLDEETDSGIPVLGNVDDVAVAVTRGVDVVFFAGGSHTSAADMRQAVWELEGHSVQLVVAPNVSEISGDRIKLRPVGGLPLVHIDPPRWSDASRLGKRAFDLVGSIGLLVVLAPVMVTATLWVKLSDRGPVLFRQQRVGRDGEVFDCLKFRSMVTNAEELLAQLHADEGYDGTGLFKMKRDPRITRPGRLLRRLSIDELPQLWNVVRGEMSLVGPRPPLPLEVQGYDEHMSRRLRVRPGLTGLWQVSGRSDLTFDEAIRLDLYYVDNWSMVQDLMILARTLGAVVRSRGAY